MCIRDSRHLVVSPIGSSLRKSNMGAQLQTFPYPTASKSFLYSNTFMAKQWRRVHWARSGLGPTFNQPGQARFGCFYDCCLIENNYFDWLNFTFDCHAYIAVTHNRNCNRLSIPSASIADVCTVTVTVTVTDS